jgi:uncharacterized Zn finger protein (UPF0148 family)
VSNHTYFFHCPWCKKITLFISTNGGTLKCVDCEKRRAQTDADDPQPTTEPVEPKGTV